MNSLDITQIPVWDLFIRIFHWSLASLFFIAYLSGDDGETLHVYSGYLIIALITSRIIWGFVGTRHARFNDFVKGPSAVREYFKSLATRKPEHYYGHNPVGGWMVIALIASIILTSYTGLKVYAVEEGLGPLAAKTQLVLISSAYADGDEYDEHDNEKHDEEDEFWEELHEASANFTLFLVFFHIAGVLISSLAHGENLVRAMITGNKDSAP